jgi:hypothetical protein
MFNEKNITIRYLSRKLEHKLYRPYELLDNISPMARRPHLPKMENIHVGFDVPLIELFVKGTRDMDFNTILKNSHSIENAPDYDVHIVIASTQHGRRVIYLLTWKV